MGQCQTNPTDIASRHHEPDQRVPMTHNNDKQYGCDATHTQNII